MRLLLLFVVDFVTNAANETFLSVSRQAEVTLGNRKAVIGILPHYVDFFSFESLDVDAIAACGLLCLLPIRHC